MIYEYPEYKNTTHNTRNILAGIIFGGLVGALTMLLLAPRAGKDTRRQDQEKGIELREWTTEMAAQQVENVSEAAQAGKR